MSRPRPLPHRPGSSGAGEGQIALLRAAVGDYSTEAAILLLTNAGQRLHELAAADLITVDYDDGPEAPPTGQPAGIGWAAIT